MVSPTESPSSSLPVSGTEKSTTLGRTGEHWSLSRRVELLAWLQRNAPALAELYETAVNLVYELRLPGRLRLIAHAVREIANRFPDAISGAQSSSRLNYIGRLDEIAKAWERNGLATDGSVPSITVGGSSLQNPQEGILVPSPLFRRIAGLLKDHAETRKKPLDAAIRLFEGRNPVNRRLSDTLRPIINQWLEVTDWFVRKVHVPNVSDTVIDQDELRKQFELFEVTLGALVRGFFTTVKDLDEILEDTNS